MTPLAVGPVICILGVVAAYFALRTKANSSKSMYRKLRDERERQIKAARDRSQQAKERLLQAERERAEQEAKASQQAAAAAAVAAAPEPSARATIPEVEPAPVEPTVKSEPAQSPWQTTEHPSEPEPAYTPPEPAETAPEPEPVEAPTPEPVAATQEVAEAPATGEGGQASWEVVTPAKKEEAEVAPASRAAGGHAEWELSSSEPEPEDDKKKSKRKRRETDADGQEKVGEGLGQRVLSYAGLLAALAIILLGIVFMIGSKATG